MSAYYNENDERKAVWLRELIRRGVVAPGEVDSRSIAEVTPKDVSGFAQCHFFAGIGVWSYALRLADWPDDRPVWTGSCPCPSFSAAGKGGGFNDPRHLWPDWARLIRECKPPTLFGEQVDDAIGHGWLDLVQTDLERQNYAVGKAVLGACSVGAPHIRQRLYFVAHADGRHASNRHLQRSGEHRQQPQDGLAGVGLADATSPRRTPRRAREESARRGETRLEPPGLRNAVRLADPAESRRPHAREHERGPSLVPARSPEHGELGDTERNGSRRHNREIFTAQEKPKGRLRRVTDGAQSPSYWSDCDWLECVDGKSRPVEPGTFPLAHGAPARVLRLRGYGDCIVPQVAAAFIQASDLTE